MVFWLIIIALVVFVLAMLWLPFLRGRKGDEDGTRAVLVGALEKAEAEDQDQALVAELSRRLIAHDREVGEKARRGTGWLPIFMTGLTALAIPLGALTIYAFYGSFGIIKVQAEDAELLSAIRQVEAQLKKTPDDWRGWKVIAPVYRSRGQFQEASEAYGKALSLNPNLPATERAEILADRIEVISMGGEGQLPANLNALIDEALRADPMGLKARYFEAMYYEQHRPAGEAAEKWQGFQTLAAQRGAVELAQRAERRMARLNLEDNQDQVARPQSDAINLMVARLSQRLSTEGGSSEEWLRLVRAYAVLGEEERLAAAQRAARDALQNDPQAISQLDALERELGL